MMRVEMDSNDTNEKQGSGGSGEMGGNDQR